MIAEIPPVRARNLSLAIPQQRKEEDKTPHRPPSFGFTHGRVSLDAIPKGERDISHTFLYQLVGYQTTDIHGQITPFISHYESQNINYVWPLVRNE